MASERNKGGRNGWWSCEVNIEAVLGDCCWRRTSCADEGDEQRTHSAYYRELWPEAIAGSAHKFWLKENTERRPQRQEVLFLPTDQYALQIERVTTTEGEIVVSVLKWIFLHCQRGRAVWSFVKLRDKASTKSPTHNSHVHQVFLFTVHKHKTLHVRAVVAIPSVWIHKMVDFYQT